MRHCLLMIIFSLFVVSGNSSFESPRLSSAEPTSEKIVNKVNEHIDNFQDRLNQLADFSTNLTARGQSLADSYLSKLCDNMDEIKTRELLWVTTVPERARKSFHVRLWGAIASVTTPCSAFLSSLVIILPNLFSVSNNEQFKEGVTIALQVVGVLQILSAGVASYSHKKLISIQDNLISICALTKHRQETVRSTKLNIDEMV